MKKVVYTVTRESRNGNKSMSGLGYITDKDLITACLSKKGKPYIRVLQLRLFFAIIPVINVVNDNFLDYLTFSSVS